QQGQEGISSAEFHGPGLFMGRRSEFSGEMGPVAVEDGNVAHAPMMRLIELARALRALPGRKSVVYFAESMSIYWQDEPYFQSLIDLANPGDVTTYTLDACAT